MDEHYIHDSWVDHAKALKKTSGVFCTIVIILSVLGVISSILMFKSMFDEPSSSASSFADFAVPLALAVVSVVQIFFALMMRGLCLVVLSIFVMVIAETREKINDNKVDP